MFLGSSIFFQGRVHSRERKRVDIFHEGARICRETENVRVKVRENLSKKRKKMGAEKESWAP